MSGAAKRAAQRRWRHRNCTGNPSYLKVTIADIPESVERRSETVPCFKCGVRADVACRHRPWMFQG
jgi:hypothetical protein